MKLFTPKPAVCRMTLRSLAHLLRYPDSNFLSNVGDVRKAIRTEASLSMDRQSELDALLQHLVQAHQLEVEAAYVDLFDRGRQTALHLFEHVHGDSRDRGPAMIDLIQTYEKAGLYLGDDELPDYLPVLLEFASTQPAEQAREFLAEFAHIVRVIFSALLDRQSPYASVLAAVLELAGETVEAVPVVPEPALDESWTEPEAFGGCSVAGQAKPGQSQPIHFSPRTPSSLQGALA
jgi:nitrate reductase delta subunit